MGDDDDQKWVVETEEIDEDDEEIVLLGSDDEVGEEGDNEEAEDGEAAELRDEQRQRKRQRVEKLLDKRKKEFGSESRKAELARKGRMPDAVALDAAQPLEPLVLGVVTRLADVVLRGAE